MGKYSLIRENLNDLVAESENYRLSLANSFSITCIHASLPSINMRYPEYESILEEHKVGVMIDDYEIEGLVEVVVRLEDSALFSELVKNTIKYRELYSWDKEKNELLSLYEILTQS